MAPRREAYSNVPLIRHMLTDNAYFLFTKQNLYMLQHTLHTTTSVIVTPRCNTFCNSANAASLKFAPPNDKSGSRSQEEQTQMLREFFFPNVDAIKLSGMPYWTYRRTIKDMHTP